MRTTLASLAGLALVVVSTASAEHQGRYRHLPPLRLSQILHVEVQNLAEEIDYHYSPSEWPHHQMDRIARLAKSIERDVAFRRLHRVHRNLHRMEHMLHTLDARVRSSVAVHDHGGAGHLCESVWEVKEITKAFDDSLKQRNIGSRHRHFVR